MANATFRKHGHSVALTIPPALLQALHAKAGTSVSMTVENGRLIIEPQRRPKYSLAELLGNDEPLPVDANWDTMPAVGQEIL